MTYQIVYSSVSATPMQLDQLEAILEQARSSNARQGITGALVYVDGFFLQILEGERESVERLMEGISGDLRHETVTILQAGEISCPVFADWKMAYVSATPEQIAQWVGLGATTQLPGLFEDMRQDRQRAAQVTKSILSVLLGEPEPDHPDNARLPMSERTGGCLCGSIRYRVVGEPVVARICWCRDCQRIASNGTVNAIFPTASIEITGSPLEYTSAGESGNQVLRRFCGTCGSHLFADSTGRAGLTVVRVGTLDDAASISPAATIWASSAPAWACLDPTLPKVEKQPQPAPPSTAR